MATRTVVQSLAVLAAGLVLASVTSGAPLYEITMLGFTDAEHTEWRGGHTSSADILTDNGLVAGHSRRYQGGISNLGETAWIYDGTTMVRLGFTDWMHSGQNGVRESEVTGLNSLGQATGTSKVYQTSGGMIGSSSWFYSAGQLTPLALADPIHTYNGQHHTVAQTMNGAGQVLGYSSRFLQGQERGSTLWLWENGTYAPLGFSGGQYTRGDGFEFTYTHNWLLADRVFVAGSSERYIGTDAMTEGGYTAWRYDGQANAAVGFYDAAHTRSDGYQTSHPVAINEAGHVTGYSARFAAGDSGQTAWVFDGTMTRRIGLYGPGYTYGNGTSYSEPIAINASGQVIGVNQMGNGTHHLPWFYDGSSTAEIGPTGGEYVNRFGSYDKFADLLSDSGHVAGHAIQYAESGQVAGSVPWIYDGTSTIELALDMTDGIYLRAADPEGGGTYYRSDSALMNGTGQLVGYSYQYTGLYETGQDAWLYDPSLHQMFSLVFSRSPEGYSYTEVSRLFDDGTIFGIYQDYGSQETPAGGYYFSWTIADGLTRIASMSDPSSLGGGWTSLSWITDASSGGHILGQGSYSGIGSMPFLLTPIPEPATAALSAGLAAIMLLQRWRRRV